MSQQPIHVPVSSVKVSAQWVISLRHLSDDGRSNGGSGSGGGGRDQTGRLDLNFVGLESGLDVVLGRRAGAVVRDLPKLLQSKKSYDEELGLDLADLLGEFAYEQLYVLVLAGGGGGGGGGGDAGADDGGGVSYLSMNTKKWREYHRRLRETPGVHPLVCVDAADAAAHLLVLLKGERAAGRALRRLMPGGGPALAFLRECPGVGYGTAVSLAAHFRGRKMSQLLRCGGGDLQAAAPWLSAQQRRNLLHFFARAFGGHM